MKAILSFDLDDHDDREAHMRCIKALDLCLLLHDLDNELRGKIKHATEDDPEDFIRGLENARIILYGLMEHRNINFDELMT
jgi:hypothetical protein